MTKSIKLDSSTKTPFPLRHSTPSICSVICFTFTSPRSLYIISSFLGSLPRILPLDYLQPHWNLGKVKYLLASDVNLTWLKIPTIRYFHHHRTFSTYGECTAYTIHTRQSPYANYSRLLLEFMSTTYLCVVVHLVNDNKSDLRKINRWNFYFRLLSPQSSFLLYMFNISSCVYIPSHQHTLHKSHLNSILIEAPFLFQGGNTLVIAAVLTTRRLRTVTNCFVMSLAVADWLVGVFVMPPKIVLHLSSKSHLYTHTLFLSLSPALLCLLSHIIGSSIQYLLVKTL